MRPLLISSGEPAGIGPDICLALADYDLPVVILADLLILKKRAKELKKKIEFIEYNPEALLKFKKGQLIVYSIACPNPVIPGELDPGNAPYVLDLLSVAARLCAQEEFSGLVTAPVHKANINAAGIEFTGHTEFFAQFFQADSVVMMLACAQMRVALVTTHIPLRQVADVITSSLIERVIKQVNDSLIEYFGIENPRIQVAGLNPHAGESGYLGREEIDVIIPSLKSLKSKGINVHGPSPADTLFTKKHLQENDVFVAMYHDQGLPVIKFADFSHSVNVTLGLPIIRTSVDHGTALELAGKNLADPSSMYAAVTMALSMASNRKQR